MIFERNIFRVIAFVLFIYLMIFLVSFVNFEISYEFVNFKPEPGGNQKRLNEFVKVESKFGLFFGQPHAHTQTWGAKAPPRDQWRIRYVPDDFLKTFEITSNEWNNFPIFNSHLATYLLAQSRKKFMKNKLEGGGWINPKLLLRFSLKLLVSLCCFE